MKNDKIIEILSGISKVIIAHEDELTELDRKIGDGDHGSNLKRGFYAVSHKLDELKKNASLEDQDLDLSQLLNQSAITLLSTVGGASGPLYATALMRMTKVFKDKGDEAIDIDLIKQAVGEMVEGVKERGNAVMGDKTMVDTIEPFYNAFKKAVESNKNLKESYAEGLIAAKEGMESTRDIAAKRGRASYLGERSIGTIDPGAYSSYLILKTIYNEI